MSEFLNTKRFSLKDIHQINLKKFLLLVKLKIQFHGHMLLMILIVKRLLDHFMNKNWKRLVKKNLELKRELREKEKDYMPNGKVMIILLIVG